MIEILPIKSLRDEDALIFGSPNVLLGKLFREDLPAGKSFCITAPELHLKTVLEAYDFGSKEVFEQSLILFKNNIKNTPVPPELNKELGKHKHFFVFGVQIDYLQKVWIILLNNWIEQIKVRLWKNGFYPGVTVGLDSAVVTVIEKLEALGDAFFEESLDEVIVNIKGGELKPENLAKIDEIVRIANKKLFIPHKYEWILDGGLPAGRQVKLVEVLPYTPNIMVLTTGQDRPTRSRATDLVGRQQKLSAVKVFLDLSTGFTVEKDIDGVYISSEKIFDLDHPQNSFEELIFRLVEVAAAFTEAPVLMKLADMSEGLPAGRQGMGKVRGALRLIHQKSLFDPLVEAILFSRNKKNLDNIHLVIPFVRGTKELLQIKRELSAKELNRKKSLQIWMEIAVPENIINIENYLEVGLDGIVLNLDELIAHLNGFDHMDSELTFYKNEVNGLLKFLENGLKLLHKSRVPFITYGSLSLYPQVLEYLVEKGVFGIVVERYEAPSVHDLLHQAERRMILRRSS